MSAHVSPKDKNIEFSVFIHVTVSRLGPVRK